VSGPAGQRRIERIARKYRIGEEPGMVEEYANFSNAERARLFLALRKRHIMDRYGPDQRFERICTVARRA
jgi:hypothetical protein